MVAQRLTDDSVASPRPPRFSSLNHPHICTLHDVGREGDTDFLVMEWVAGETLADRLAKGALPTKQVLRLAIARRRGPRPSATIAFPMRTGRNAPYTHVHEPLPPHRRHPQ